MPGQIECPHCGKKMAVGYPSCLSCKKHLGPTDSPLKKMARSKKATYVVMPEEKKTYWPWIALAVALFCIAAYFVKGTQDQPRPNTAPSAVQQTQSNTTASPVKEKRTTSSLLNRHPVVAKTCSNSSKIKSFLSKKPATSKSNA